MVGRYHVRRRAQDYTAWAVFLLLCRGLQALERNFVGLRQRLDVLAPGVDDGGHVYAGELDLLQDFGDVYKRDGGLFLLGANRKITRLRD